MGLFRSSPEDHYSVPDMKVGLLLVCFAIVSICSTANPWTGYRGMSLNFQDEVKGENLEFKESSSSSSEENNGTRNEGLICPEGCRMDLEHHRCCGCPTCPKDPECKDCSSSSSSEENIGTGNEQENPLMWLHNWKREERGVPNLILDAELSRNAQKWADHMAETGEFRNSRHPRDVAENIFNGGNFSDPTQLAMDQWMDGERFYDYSAGGCKEMDSCPALSKGQKVVAKEGKMISCCWDFAKVVWKSSKKIGIGQANPKGQPDYYYIVVHYQPGGIFKDTTPEEFKENVLRPISLGNETVSSEKISVKKLVSAGLDLLKAGKELKLNVDIKNPESIQRANETGKEGRWCPPGCFWKVKIDDCCCPAHFPPGCRDP